MKILLTLITLISALPAMANLHLAPPAFKVSGGRAIFVDFIRATYDLQYDYKARTAVAETTITFIAEDTGYPIFDTVQTPQVVWLNGQEVDHVKVPVPGYVSYVRIAKDVVTPGVHVMKVRTPIINGTKYTWKGVQSGFFIKDLKDRKMLERFVPTNLEYDQYEMVFRVQIDGTHKSHNVFANGEVTELGHNLIEIRYPNFFTASSLYFHLVPKSRFWRLHFNYTSITGRQVPVTIYSNWRLRNWIFKRKTLRVLRELENDYGPYPHPKVLIYGTKLKGGMEYVGATATSYVALGHELHHFYFAKGVMPADGNSGWMDEGIASWRDKGYQTHSKPNYYSFNLGKHNVYTRKTDKNSYEKGRSFFAYLDYQLKALGKPGFKDFLRGYFNKHKFTNVTTEDMIQDLEEYAGVSFREDFNQYVFGGHASLKGRAPAITPDNPFHPHLTDEELDSLI
jgi:hypothetical protein